MPSGIPRDLKNQSRLQALAGPPQTFGGVQAALSHPCEYGMMSNISRLDPLADSAPFGDSQIVVVLKVQPELRGQTKILPQANRSIGTDASVPADHLIDAGEVERLRQCVRAHAHRFHELSLENLPRMHRKDLSRFHS